MTNNKISEKWLLTYLGSPPFQCDMPILEAIYLRNDEMRLLDAQIRRRLQLEQFLTFLFNNRELTPKYISSNSSYELLRCDRLTWSTADIQINEDMVCTVEFPNNSIICRLVVRIEPGAYHVNFQTFINYPLEPGIVSRRENFILFDIYGTDIIYTFYEKEKSFNSYSELAIEVMGSIGRPLVWLNPDVERFKAKFLHGLYGDLYIPSLEKNEQSNLIRLLKYLEN